MLQALCWPVARLAGLACVVASGSGSVLLLNEAEGPMWVQPWVVRMLRAVGAIRRGESPVTLGAMTLAARRRLISTGEVRMEFASGAFERLGGLVMREADDFAFLKGRDANRGGAA